MARKPVSKQAARKNALELRAKLGKTRRAELSHQICTHLAALPQLDQGKQIALFWPLPHEVDIRHLIVKWASAGRSLFLPLVVGRNQQLQMHNISVNRLTLNRGYGGIFEPTPVKSSFELAQIDLILVPASSVDQHGNRVGSGQGFYDITLKNMPNSLAICPLFSCQLSSPIAAEKHDIPVDLIVTEDGIINPHKELKR